MFGPCHALGGAQLARGTSVQMPVVRSQHAPGGWGQRLGEQDVFGPSQVLGARHPDQVAMKHAPLIGLQQAPSGSSGQGFGKQPVPGPCQNPGAPQAGPNFNTQEPSGMQQAPAGRRFSPRLYK